MGWQPRRREDPRTTTRVTKSRDEREPQSEQDAESGDVDQSFTFTQLRR